MAYKEMMRKTPIIIVIIANVFLSIAMGQSSGDIIFRSEPVFISAPFNECHASTIAETPQGLVVAFFAGTEEKNPDVGIWVCRDTAGKWTRPLEVANGIQNDSLRYPCWNPVLFQFKDGPLMLFFKVGPNPSEWWGMLMFSYDNGITWTKPERLPDGIMGPVKNKPEMLKNGVLLCPSSVEGEEWYVQMEMTADTGKTWSKVIVPEGETKFNVIQPAILKHKNGKLQILCRSKENCIVQSWSKDNGMTWSPLSAMKLPNPNSGIDAVTLTSGLSVVVYNPATVPEGKWTGDRTPLCVAVSKRGKRWHDIATLESGPGEFSYPAVIQTSNGLLHIVYTWKRKTIMHTAISP
jgi:predicted neuraminidase